MAEIHITRTLVKCIKDALLKERSSKDIKSSHLSEAIAAGFGYKSHAALLSALDETGGVKATWEPMDFTGKLSALTGKMSEVSAIKLAQHASLALKASTEGPKTRLEYMYRDGSNFKVHRTVVFSGAPTEDLKARLLAACGHDGFDPEFIPGLVGLRDLQKSFLEKPIMIARALGQEKFLAELEASKPRWDPERDHIYHTIEDVSVTSEDATDPRSFEEFVEDCEAAEWDETYKPPFYEEMLANYEAGREDELEV